MDNEIEEQRRKDRGELLSEEESSSDEEEEEDWEKPSAYSLLIGSLKKTSKNKDFYKKIQLEQEGLEDMEIEDMEDNGLEENLEGDHEQGIIYIYIY